MGKRLHLDHIIVVDLESTCWESKSDQPFREESEIIEIGICLLSVKSLQTTQKAQYLITPTRSKVSEFCSDLTGLTQAKLDNEGMSFEAACGKIQDRFKTKKRVWASYGEYDRKMFMNQCEKMDIEYPFNHRHINVKTYFPIVFGLGKEMGMDKALQAARLPLEGVHHCGADDAWNTSRLLAECIRGGAAYG